MVGNFNFRGEYGNYARTLTSEDRKSGTKLFVTLYECLIFSAYYGLLNNAYIDTDKIEGSVADGSVVREEVLMKRSGEYNEMRKIVILLEGVRNFDNATKVDYALRYDLDVDNSQDDVFKEISKYSENSKIIEGYVYGGLKALYERYESHLKSYGDLLYELRLELKKFEDDSKVLERGELGIDNSQ